MKTKFGVDISYHNGNIDFAVLSKNVDFVIIRAGYGQGNIDKKLTDYVAGCNEYDIPYGFYWFSYASTQYEAEREAKFFYDTIHKYKPSLPLFFDYEELSKIHKQISFNEIGTMAAIFINTLRGLGYKCGIYCDNEYYEGYAKEFAREVPIWYARWTSATQTKGDIWQYSSTGKIDGIKGNVDMNYCYMDFSNEVPSDGYKENDNTCLEKTKKLIDANNENLKKYLELATKIIDGKYGNGDERINKLKAEGYDAGFAQKIVNILIE